MKRTKQNITVEKRQSNCLTVVIIRFEFEMKVNEVNFFDLTNL